MIASIMNTLPATKPRVAMIQDGARRRYALPTALHEAGILEAMYTDWFVQPDTSLESLAELASKLHPSTGRKLLGRQCASLNSATVHCSPLLTARTTMGAKRFASNAAYYHWASRLTTDWVKRVGFGKANALLGFIRNLDPALVAYAKSQGLKTVGDQIIAPAAVERDEARTQVERFPGWQDDVEDDELGAFVSWEQQTWANLDRIICMSDYVRDGLLREGVASEKIKLIPYPIDATRFHVADRTQRDGPITIGFVGAMNLRKGAPYIFEVAKQFDPDKARFVAIGSNYLNDEKVEANKGNVQLIGRIPRDEVATWLDRFDVFFFPTTCEGSAGSVMEAMCCGLPVVTTHNAGSLVEHETSGYIIPCGDTDGFTQAIQELVDDPSLREAMGKAGRARAEQQTLDWYSSELVGLFEQLVSEDASAAATG